MSNSEAKASLERLFPQQEGYTIADQSYVPVSYALVKRVLAELDAALVSREQLERWVLCLSQGDISPRREMERILNERSSQR